MYHNVMIALEIMGKGMAGIFVATLLIIGVIVIMTKFPSKNTPSDKADSENSAN